MSDLLARLVAAGCPAGLVGEVAAAIAKAEATTAAMREAIEARRANDRARKARQVHVKSREVTGKAVNGDGPPSPPSPPLDGFPSHSPSLIPPLPPPSPNEGSGVKSPGPIGKHLLPDDFEPNDATKAKATKLGISEDGLQDRIDAMREWSRGKGERRLDWNLVLQGFLRRDAAGSGPRAPPNGNGTGKHGKVTFGDFARMASDELQRRRAAGDDDSPTFDLEAERH